MNAKTNIINLQNGTYSFKLTVKNDIYSNSDTVNVTLLQNTKTISLALKKGWNLISINVIPNNASTSSILPNSSLIKSNDGYFKSGQPSVFNSINEIVAGVGYLVYNAIDETISITGTEMQSIVYLHTGWNLVGVPIQSNFTVTSLPTQTIIVKDFDGFYEKGNTMSTISELQVGKAYYIKVSDNCEINW
ncbi:MAG: hypothetical protein IPO21_05000 [Bacteroidales bacterium]|nr:hypothetical protein [Bacteroidales bacterium]